MDQFKFVQTQSTTLAGAGAVIGDTSVILSSFTQIDGTTTITMTDFGAIGYMTLEPNSGTQEEQISFSNIVQNANGTATLTGVKSVLFVAPYTESSGLAKTHAGGTKAIVSNTAGFYNKLTGKTDDETISGTWTFTAPNYPQIDVAATLPTLDAQFATKKYIDGIAIAGSPDASTTVKGIGEVSVAPVSATTPIFVGDNDGRVPTQGENDALVGNNTDIAVGSGNKFVTQTGFQHNAEKYVLDTSGSSTAYVGVLSPLATSLTTGMVIYAKIINANTTTTPTFTFTGTATAKTIVKLTNTPLAAGDIGANSFNTLIYDGTNLVLQSPIANIVSGAIYAVNADESVVAYQTYQVPLLPTSNAVMQGWTIGGTTPLTYNGAASYLHLVDGGGGSALISTLLIGSGSTSNYSPAQSKVIRYKQLLRVTDTTDRKGWGFCITAANIYTAQTDTTNGEVRFILNGAVLYAQNANGTATSTDISSGITVTDWNLYEIVFTPTVNIKFYINGTLKATHATNLPTTGTFLLAMGNDANGRIIDMMPPVVSIQI